MQRERSEITRHLDAWHAGDEAALGRILERLLPSIQAMVRKRQTRFLRGKEETADFVQEAILKFLRFGPRVRIESEKSLCHFLARVVQNILHDRYDFYTASRREAGTPVTLHTMDLHHQETPSRILNAEEERSLVRVGLEFLGPEDREVIFMRKWDGLTNEAIAQKLGIARDAAAKRFSRAMERLTHTVRGLEAGKLDALLAGTGQDSGP